MDISRRGFMGMLAAATASRTYFFAPVGGWKSDLIINPNDIRTLTTPSISDGRTYYHGRYSAISVSGIDPHDFEIHIPKRGKRRMSTLPPESRIDPLAGYAIPASLFAGHHA